MSTEGLLVLLAGSLIAFVNGTNDVSKGIATLVGTGLSDYRRAIRWGTFWTAVGGLAGALFAGAMVTTFGKGLLAPDVAANFPAALASILGAAAWVLFATRTGLPVSTTHAIVGSVVGVAAIAYGAGAVQWGALGGKVLLPLLLTPVISLMATAALLQVFRSRGRGREANAQRAAADCLCAAVEPAKLVSLGMASGSTASFLVAPPEVRLSTGTSAECAAQPAAARVTLNHLHWLTSGATSFARGMNDAPKMVALVLAASLLSGSAAVSSGLAFAMVTASMVGGSLVGGRRVTHVLATKVTPMNHGEGLAANFVTSLLVAVGAVGGFPMSTTHVSSGGIIGAGSQREKKGLNFNTIREMLLAWVVTLPASALLGAASYGLAKLLQG